MRGGLAYLSGLIRAFRLTKNTDDKPDAAVRLSKFTIVSSLNHPERSCFYFQFAEWHFMNTENL